MTPPVTREESVATFHVQFSRKKTHFKIAELMTLLHDLSVRYMIEP